MSDLRTELGIAAEELSVAWKKIMELSNAFGLYNTPNSYKLEIRLRAKEFHNIFGHGIISPYNDEYNYESAITNRVTFYSLVKKEDENELKEHG